MVEQVKTFLAQDWKSLQKQSDDFSDYRQSELRKLMTTCASDTGFQNKKPYDVDSEDFNHESRAQPVTRCAGSPSGLGILTLFNLKLVFQHPTLFRTQQMHNARNNGMAASMRPKARQEEADQDYGSETHEDHWFSDSSHSDNEQEPRLTMYAAFTQYDVVKEVAKQLGFHLSRNEASDWDVAWFDGAICQKFLQKMHPYQRTNHFPGIYNLARKNCLGKHLMRMQKWFPNEYDFFPQTFMLPLDSKELKAQINGKRNKTFIVKPEASCQGKGIFLTRSLEDIDPTHHCVVQRYMHKPFLLDGFKFDLRLYVLLAGVAPLRVFLFREGLARLATEPYESPMPANLGNQFMHLTNYAINKDSPSFQPNFSAEEDYVGSKRSYSSVLNRIEQEFGSHKREQVQIEIKDIIIKTLCIAQPNLSHLYRSSQPEDLTNSMCFQILGFDVMLDWSLKPQLLEVNQSPSFSTDSPLDYKIKHSLITHALQLQRLSLHFKVKAKLKRKTDMQQRLLKPTLTSDLKETRGVWRSPREKDSKGLRKIQLVEKKERQRLKK